MTWGDWLWVGIGVPVLAPLGGLLLVWFIHQLASGSGGLPPKIVARIQALAPFRDGQMGYVALGWAVAAYYEMHAWQFGKTACPWVENMDKGLWAFGALSGIIAAFGSVSPVEAMPAGATAPARWSKKWFQRYLAAISSIIVAFILVVMMILIHRWTEGATCQ